MPAFFSGVPAASASGSAVRRPTDSGVSVWASIAPVAQLDHVGGPADVELVEPVRRWTPPARARSPARRAPPAMTSRKRRSETPTSCRVAPGGIGERAQEVEDRAHGQLLAHRDHVLHRGVVAGREHEAEAELVDAARHRLGGQVDARAQRLEHVRRAGPARGRAVAVLGHPAAGAGGHEGRRGGHVERGPPAARAGGVHQAVAARLHRAPPARASRAPCRPAPPPSRPWRGTRSAAPRSGPRSPVPPSPRACRRRTRPAESASPRQSRSIASVSIGLGIRWTVRGRALRGSCAVSPFPAR